MASAVSVGRLEPHAWKGYPETVNRKDSMLYVVTAARLDGVAHRGKSERGPEHRPLSRWHEIRRQRSRQGQEPRRSTEAVMKRFGYTVGFVGFLLLVVAFPLYAQQ